MNEKGNLSINSENFLPIIKKWLYTDKDIFIRELVSNACDAVTKLKKLMIMGEADHIPADEAFSVHVVLNKEEKIMQIVDNGIGMTHEEIKKYINQIAFSGAQDFLNKYKDKANEDQIIGHFGLGFYSAFMVASKVRVVSKAYGEEQAWAWESDGVEGYTIEVAERETNGTDVILTLKDNTEEENYDQFLSEYGLKDLIKRYSNYVRYPVQMMVTKSREKERPADAGDDYKPEYEDYEELETINSMTPIWKKRSSDVSEEDYNEFYKSTFHDFEDPARTVSFHAEGTLEYDALLYIPSRAPFDLYSKDYEKGLALYSSNVLIMEKCADLLPDYYNFVRGVVDSQDISCLLYTSPSPRD